MHAGLMIQSAGTCRNLRNFVMFEEESMAECMKGSDRRIVVGGTSGRGLRVCLMLQVVLQTYYSLLVTRSGMSSASIGRFQVLLFA